MKEKIKESVGTEGQVPKSRPSWLSDLAVKDLWRPITIRRIRLYQAGAAIAILSLVSYYVWDQFLRTPSGVELVNEMVTAAGGMETWNKIQSGQFTRTQYLNDEAGNQLSKKVQTYYFQKKDGNVKLMVKSIDKDGTEAWVGQDKDGFWSTLKGLPSDPTKTARDLGMMCDSKFCAPTCAASMAFYRFSMPFKLNDFGVRPKVTDGSVLALLDWNPLEFINIDPLVLDITYKEEVGRDKWRFLVDPKDKLIHKIEYYNKSDFGTFRPEETYWSDHKTVDGITFSHKWTRYWGNGQVMEETIFSDVNFENELSDKFFDRPEGLDWLSMN